MTTVTAPSTAPATARSTAAARLRALLLVDGAGTTALGAATLVAADPLADLVGTPTALRVVGALFVLLGAEMLLARRLSGRRLGTAALVLGEADLAFAAVSVGAVLVLGASAGGTALVLAVVAVCVGMGVVKLRLARLLRAS
jgi:hypothetical protein